jgi:hypothetical protein
MHVARFRALITLDPADGHPAAPTRPTRARADEYQTHTHCLVVRVPHPRDPALIRYYGAEISWDDQEPLHPGDKHKVTITVTDDDAPEVLIPGQRIKLWAGEEVGHGVISRRVFTEQSPA